MWAWGYLGKFQDDTNSDWLTDEQDYDSYSSLQLDVFHALWEETHGPETAARPAGEPTRGEREVATAVEALRELPVGAEIGRELSDDAGNVVLRGGRMRDFSDPYRRVEYPDGDWEELSCQEPRQAIDQATRIPEPGGVGWTALQWAQHGWSAFFGQYLPGHPISTTADSTCHQLAFGGVTFFVDDV